MDDLQPEQLLPDGFDAALLSQLRAAPQGLSEYQLIRQLADCFPDSLFAEPGALQDPLRLFQLHFLLFHQLYRLADQLAADSLSLQIHALSIRLLPRDESLPGLQQVDPLRAYYLDWQQWRDIHVDDVQRLLDGFWRRQGRALVAPDELAQALAALQLEQPTDARAIKQRYRALVRVHHPDRGGSTARVQEINQAMLILERYYGKN
ncbi:DNA-J related protein [Halopseudomonas sabulinigri]|uniref:DNA-J related protein n=1 Tax=Halopseudomonas sabulinigri TaxID=472181 RepID=A0A1H1P9H0_9GAMM|nr:DNA-J related domain-containing protein [Halopseudomonas sabulinigri]SDS07817.1 DNA-J related protein [Halopseudomonas sabulinigri]